MARRIPLRFSLTVYETVNSWVEDLLDVEDMRRRCAEHGRWMAAHPEAFALTEVWADRNLDELARR